MGLLHQASLASECDGPVGVTFIKQNGALLAKGRLLGVQFDTLFTDGLYFEISKNAIEMAEKMKKMFKDKGYKIFIDSPTNQQFFILDNDKMAELQEKVVFEFWERLDENRAVVRFCTSWATTEKDLEELSKII